MDASQYRTRYSRKVVARSIRRSTQAASTGVLYRAGPPGRGRTLFRLRKRSWEIAARIIRMCVAPFLHQRLQLRVVSVRQHDPGGDEQVAGAARFRQAFALQAKNPAARRILRD